MGLGPEIMDVFKLSALAIVLTFMGILMKKAERESEFKVISIIALLFILGVVGTYIVDFFETVQTMLVF